MSIVKTAKVQTGISNTSTNNFHTRAPEDGTFRVSRGNADGTPTDVLVIGSDDSITGAVYGLKTLQEFVGTGLRVASTLYTNTKPYPIDVVVNVTISNTGTFTRLVVDSIDFSKTQAPGSGSYTYEIKAVVPPGKSYQVTGGSFTIQSWRESQ